MNTNKMDDSAAFNDGAAVLQGLLLCAPELLDKQLAELEAQKLELVRRIAELDAVSAAIRAAKGLQLLNRLSARGGLNNASN